MPTLNKIINSKTTKKLTSEERNHLFYDIGGGINKSQTTVAINSKFTAHF